MKILYIVVRINIIWNTHNHVWQYFYEISLRIVGCGWHSSAGSSL